MIEVMVTPGGEHHVFPEGTHWRYEGEWLEVWAEMTPPGILASFRRDCVTWVKLTPPELEPHMCRMFRPGLEVAKDPRDYATVSSAPAFDGVPPQE